MRQQADRRPPMALIRALADDARFCGLSERQKRFCPFEAVGMARQEIRHSNFLAYLIDPQRGHRTIGGGALKGLLNAAGVDSAGVAGPDLNSARIYREWNWIDILIEVPPAAKTKGLVVAIEVKVDAGESEGQLARYHRRVTGHYPADHWTHVFIFLTPDGREPVTHDDTPWQPLSFAELMDQIALGLAGMNHPIVEMFDSYRDMLRRHGVMPEPDEEPDETIRQLWSEHREALEFLLDWRQRPLGDALRDLDERQDEWAVTLGDACGVEVTARSSLGKWRRFAFTGLSAQFPELSQAGDPGWTPLHDLAFLEVFPENNTVRGKLVVGWHRSDAGWDEVFRQAISAQTGQEVTPARKRLQLFERDLLSWNGLRAEGDDSAFAQALKKLAREGADTLRRAAEVASRAR